MAQRTCVAQLQALGPRDGAISALGKGEVEDRFAAGRAPNEGSGAPTHEGSGAHEGCRLSRCSVLKPTRVPMPTRGVGCHGVKIHEGSDAHEGCRLSQCRCKNPRGVRCPRGVSVATVSKSMRGPVPTRGVGCHGFARTLMTRNVSTRQSRFDNHVSTITFRQSRFDIHVSTVTFRQSCFDSHASTVTFRQSRFDSHVSIVTLRQSRFDSHVSMVTFRYSRFDSYHLTVTF